MPFARHVLIFFCSPLSGRRGAGGEVLNQLYASFVLYQNGECHYGTSVIGLNQLYASFVLYRLTKFGMAQ